MKDDDDLRDFDKVLESLGYEKIMHNRQGEKGGIMVIM